MSDNDTQRGLVIMGALLNFADWLNASGFLSKDYAEQDRGSMVREFLAAHSAGENYFLQADEIAARLGEPFVDKEHRP